MCVFDSHIYCIDLRGKFYNAGKMLRNIVRRSLVRKFSTNNTSTHPILSKLSSHPSDRIAVRHVISGNSYTYGQLVEDIFKWRNILSSNDPKGNRAIAIMGENSYQFVVPFFAALTLPNALAMPLCTNHTAAEINYQLENSGAQLIVTPKRFVDKVDQFATGRKLLVCEEAVEPVDPPVPVEPAVSSSYMLYTSGTSGKPKGVVTPLETFVAQAKALTEAWSINSSTNMLHTLPLHHVHGLVIGLTLPLLAGGRVEFLFPFSAEKAIGRLADVSLPQINTYTAVPTVYTRIVDYVNTLTSQDRQKALDGLQHLQLAMCGSAALPTPLRDSWGTLTHNKVPLLERYGMTETGITLSQPLDPQKRIDGSVGRPVPSVLARLVDPESGEVVYQYDQSSCGNCVGEVQLRGPVVFKEYWENPSASNETFTEDGWFRTGDIARVDQSGNLFMLGRSSMDIIKSGGEKLSALEIEREMLSLPQISECSVVGVDSQQWGQEVAAVVVLTPKGREETFGLSALRTKLKETLTGYKIPKRLLIVDQIPRNQMGKVNKKTLVKLFD
jgi:malonyl-CoA/methylmalonyl-CoA synthetase